MFCSLSDTPVNPSISGNTSDEEKQETVMSQKQDDQDFTEIAQHRIIKRLGAGTYGRVYLGQHPLLDWQVAIKVFLGNIDTTQERDLFLKEAGVLAQLKHPHILSFHGVGIQKGLYERDLAYLLLEYAPGGSLRDRLHAFAPDPLPLDEALNVLSQIGDGLDYAHQQGIVHRDLKPENILFNAKGEALLADFGIAVVLSSGTQSEEIRGTPAYMAPEQIQGNASQKSDQYALGCIAYEMLTGHRPFAGSNPNALIYQHMHERPSPPRSLNPNLPVSVEQAILRAMAKDRKKRYTDVPTFLTALRSPLLAPTLPASSSDRSSVSLVPPHALHQQDEDRPFEQPIVRRRSKQSQLSVSRAQIQVARAPGRAAQSLKSQRDWRIILTCLFGLGGAIGLSGFLLYHQDLPFLLYISLVIPDFACFIIEFFGMLQALVVSYQTKDRRWLIALAAGLLCWDSSVYLEVL